MEFFSCLDNSAATIHCYVATLAVCFAHFNGLITAIFPLAEWEELIGAVQTLLFLNVNDTPKLAICIILGSLSNDGSKFVDKDLFFREVNAPAG